MSFKSIMLSKAIENKNLPAVSSHGETWSYDFLLNNSQNIINAIKGHKRVGLYFEKSKEYILSLFALTLSDSAFIPLENNSPKERLNYIINDSDIDIIITSLKYSQDILSKLPENISILYIEDLLDKNLDISNNFQESLNESAYIIYTSGSTGNPKGVNVSFNGLLNVIEQQIDILEINKDKFYLYLSISFDASLSDIYCALLSASELFIYDCLKTDIIGLKKYFELKQITHSDLPPSLLKLFKPEDLSSLKSVIIGGEVADYSTVREFSKSIKLINVYGPTEATICTSMITCDENWSQSLIGLPLNNVHYFIINENNEQINQKNIEGELVISGCQLALGYINNEKQNKERFTTLFGEKVYKTGDLVSYNEDNLIEFKGRIDRQIKYNGQLICLEEIENSINSIPEIKSVSVVFKNKKLYAYYEGNIEVNDIRLILKTKIPVYMIPTFFINKNIPKTITGKNDGKLLLKNNTEYEELQIISNLFKTILNENDLIINLNDSFIKDLGADSLNFITLHIELQHIGINIPHNHLIDHNSINDILNYKEDKKIIDTNFLINEFNNLKQPNNIRKISKQDNKIALLTGSTGLLGSYLLSKLVLYFDTVYCLVRGNDIGIAKNRLFDILNKNKIDIDSKYFDKIQIVLGDVSEERLGVNQSKYNSLINQVDTVYHCAANVNNILNFNKLYKSNVLSSVYIADFIFDGQDKELHYASTLSVHVSSDKLNNSIISEEYLENDGHQLYSGYAQTKWLSDYYFSQLNKISNNIYFYRFGLLTPSIENNNLSKNSFLYNCINDLKTINEIPESNINLSLDITPLNIATNAMYNISLNGTSNIYNISSNYQLTLNKIANLLNINYFINKDIWLSKHNKLQISQYMVDLNHTYLKQHNMNLFETTHINYFITNNSSNYIENFNINKYLINLIKI
jgi:amino acid adenylation domain-containing protein